MVFLIFVWRDAVGDEEKSYWKKAQEDREKAKQKKGNEIHPLNLLVKEW